MPEAGRVIFEESDITRLPAYRRAPLGIGRTFQIPRPFSSASVRENVAVGAMFGTLAGKVSGVGKTTLLRTILGSVEPWGGRISYEEKDVTRLPTHTKVGLGIVLVPEGRHLFSGMTVHENLMMGAYPKEATKHTGETLELVYSLFPILKERTRQKAGSLSGGQQQMVTMVSCHDALKLLARV